MGSVVVVNRLLALRQVGSSKTRDQTDVPCIKRQILNYWTTKKVLESGLENSWLRRIVSWDINVALEPFFPFNFNCIVPL